VSVVGAKLQDGWTVVREVVRTAQATGGCFSQSFIVERNGQQAFMKALDYMRALQSSDPATLLHELTQEFLFEKGILSECQSRKMRRIIRQMGHGVLQLQVAGLPITVQYLILEKADDDLRHTLDGMTHALRARALHQVAVGLNQLHQISVAHQDLKPSNVLLFHAEGAKVGDLGCAFQKGTARSRDRFLVAGDPRYAPPELLYGHGSQDYRLRRLGCDTYNLGNLMFLMWTKLSLTSDMQGRLDQGFRWQVWNGQFVDVLPELRSAFEDSLRCLGSLLPPYATKIVTFVRELCDPDPRKRKIVSGGSDLPLETYVSMLDRIARICEWNERRP
jgi:eukaryotic-like serine/threonine-protein kinase